MQKQHQVHLLFALNTVYQYLSELLLPVNVNVALDSHIQEVVLKQAILAVVQVGCARDHHVLVLVIHCALCFKTAVATSLHV